PVPQEVPNNEVIENQADFDASLDMDDRLDTSQGPPQDEEEEEEEQEIFMVVENQPELIGGMKALSESVDYPEFAKKAGIEGRVIVQFVVDEQGNVRDPKVTRGVHKLLNEEAIKAVKDQKFKPGKQRGQAVKVQMSLPVTFRLQ
ncbi:MAG: energy transducer TonB, partial [Salinibacter sp.]